MRRVLLCGTEAAVESLRSLWAFPHLIAGCGVTYPETDVTKSGGITAFMKIPHLAEAFNLPVTSHGGHSMVSDWSALKAIDAVE